LATTNGISVDVFSSSYLDVSVRRVRFSKPMYSVSRYSFPNYLARSEIIRMSGFPHSEICGSKVAHTSPQLIAACHVLHRLYAPRHPRIALTSRLRVHTTNDNAGSSLRTTRNSAEQRRLALPGAA